MMNDEPEPMPIVDPVRYGCRVCLVEVEGSSTVCTSCKVKVKAATGGVEDHHVRQYISARNRVLAGEVPIDLRPIKVGRGPTAEKRQLCTCGQAYSREISVAACEARDHRRLDGGV